MLVKLNASIVLYNSKDYVDKLLEKANSMKYGTEPTLFRVLMDLHMHEKCGSSIFNL